MTEDVQREHLHNLCDRLFGPSEKTLLRDRLPPFDISRPNIHDNKKEFTKEREAVKAIIGHLQGILDNILGDAKEPGDQKLNLRSGMNAAIELSAYNRIKSKFPRRADELALHNFAQTGFVRNSLAIMNDMLEFYRERQLELARQEAQFWSVPNRAPNYFPRTIALRFAELYAKRTGKKPTFGTSSAGNHPSTDYGRALEEVFKILGIKANVRKAAEWAMGQLTEDDWRPQTNYIADMLSSLHSPTGAHTNAIALGVRPELLKKRRKKEH